MGNKVIVAVGVMVLVLIIIIFAIGYGARNQETAIVLTDKTEYTDGDIFKVKIENNLKKNVCFSSCYPYYLEKKNQKTEWESYDYSECPNTDLIEKCVEPRQTKAFEFVLPVLREGVHRLAIPICVGCNSSETFREDQWLYSNEFIVK